MCKHFPPRIKKPSLSPKSCGKNILYIKVYQQEYIQNKTERCFHPKAKHVPLMPNWNASAEHSWQCLTQETVQKQYRGQYIIQLHKNYTKGHFPYFLMFRKTSRLPVDVCFVTTLDGKGLLKQSRNHQSQRCNIHISITGITYRLSI